MLVLSVLKKCVLYYHNEYSIGSVTFRIVHFRIVTFRIVHFRIVTFRLGNISYR